MKNPSYWHQTTLVALALFSSSCNFNVFGFVDEPDGDVQLTSAARACFDRGDLTCAREYYEKLSPYAGDTRYSEEAFALLDEYGAGMGNFISAFGSGDGGAGLTTLADKIANQGGDAGGNKRLNFYRAYKKITYIHDSSLRGLVRFVTALAIACEVLAEASRSDHALQKADLAGGSAATVAACTANGTACGAGDANCGKPSDSALSNSASVTDLTATTESAMGAATPDLGMLQSALSQVSYALRTELNVSGKFNSGTLATIEAINAQSVTLNSGQCYRSLLIANGVGN